jgi:RNA polymerase sigma factor (sigma-70 family)
VFVRILKYRATYREGGRFETWLFRIARNARADYFQRPGVQATALDAAADRPSSASDAAAVLERRQETDRLRRALLMLREDQREIIILARYRGMKYEAIADVLDVEVGTVKVRMHRAIKQLREIFLKLSEKQSCNVKLSAPILPTA